MKDAAEGAEEVAGEAEKGVEHDEWSTSLETVGEMGCHKEEEEG